jgi:hypothetical protein
MATRIDSNSAEGVFLTLTWQTPLKEAVDNLWYNSGVGPNSVVFSGILVARMLKTF